MAISQVSRGVYVVSPARAQKYKDTAAGEYTSVFTKERAKQWELAQKQALMNIEVGAERYKQEMALYRDRVKATEDLRAQYEKELDDIRSGRLSAEDVSKRTSARLIQEAREEKARRQELQAKTGTRRPGGTVTTESRGTTTGTGTTAPTAGARARTGPSTLPTDQLDTIGAAVRDAETVAQAVAAFGQSRTGGRLPSVSPDMSDLQNNTLVESLTDELSTGTGMSRSDAREAVLTELRNVPGGGAIVDSATRTVVTPAEPAGAAPTSRTGTTTRTTTTTRPGDVLYRPYAELGELPELTPEEISAIEARVAPASRAELEAALQARLAALKVGERPVAPTFDFITQARDIAAGRFGPTPASPAYRERLVTQGLLSAPDDVRAELLRQYRTAPTTAPITQPGAVSGGPAVAPAPTPTRTEADLPLEARLLLANMGRELAVPASDKTMLETLAATELAPPATLPRVTPPVSTMRQPPQVAAPENFNLRPDTSRAAEFAELGVKPEGELVVPAGDKGEPHTSAARNTPPLSMPGRSPFPGSPEAQLEQAEAAGRFATSVGKAEDVRKVTKAGVEPELMGVKKGGPPSKVTYLQNRIETALELKAKPSKLDRLSASGAGKVARDIYRANVAKGVPFQRTWEEITMTFNGNEDAMRKAHEIALALDMLTTDTAPKE